MGDAASDASFYRQTVPRTDATPQHTSPDAAREMLADYINTTMQAPPTQPTAEPVAEAEPATEPSTEPAVVPTSAHSDVTPAPVAELHSALPAEPPQVPPHPVVTSSTVTTVLTQLRQGAGTVAPAAVSKGKPSSFGSLLKAVSKDETHDSDTAPPGRPPPTIEQSELDARQRWLTELNKLQDDYKVKLSKAQWTMQDTSRAMQYETRKAYQRLINGKQKRIAISRIKTAGQVIKYANVLFRLNIPTLMQFDKKMNELAEDPVTLYKLDEMYNESVPVAPEDPRLYIAKQVMWPIATALALKVLVSVFKPYIDVEELLEFVNVKSPATDNKPAHASRGDGAGYAGMVSQLLGSFVSGNRDSPPKPEKQSRGHKVFDLAAMLNKGTNA